MTWSFEVDLNVKRFKCQVISTLSPSVMMSASNEIFFLNNRKLSGYSILVIFLISDYLLYLRTVALEIPNSGCKIEGDWGLAQVRV
jgi:hypothetical protein